MNQQMRIHTSTSRRHLLLLGIAAMATGLVRTSAPAMAQAAVAYRNPGCGCCEKWAELMTEAGISITMEDDPDLASRKRKLAIPEHLDGCHTALIGGYIIEGHVPPLDVMRLLLEKPDIAGIAVPGMPMGSPGMEMGDAKEPFDVVAFKSDGTTTIFASHQGA
jgi:hypothetical protein